LSATFDTGKCFFSLYFGLLFFVNALSMASAATRIYDAAIFYMTARTWATSEVSVEAAPTRFSS